MKNQIKILMLTLMLLTGSVIEAYSSIIITIKIARHRDCKGLGWCNWSTVYINDGRSENEATAKVEVSGQKRLLLTLNKKTDMTPEVFTTYLSKGTFVCEDDFPVPADILKQLGLSGSYIIKAGNYPITYKGDLVTMEF